MSIYADKYYIGTRTPFRTDRKRLYKKQVLYISKVPAFSFRISNCDSFPRDCPYFYFKIGTLFPWLPSKNNSL